MNKRQFLKSLAALPALFFAPALAKKNELSYLEDPDKWWLPEDAIVDDWIDIPEGKRSTGSVIFVDAQSKVYICDGTQSRPYRLLSHAIESANQNSTIVFKVSSKS